MFSVSSSLARGNPRGRPGLPGGHGRRLVVALALAAVSLVQTGCQSGPFSPCGFFGRTATRLTRPFHRDRGACCGTEVVADGCAAGAIPAEGIVTGSAITSGPIISTTPQIGAPSAVAPAETPSDLNAIPPDARTGPAPGSTRRPSSGTGTRSPSSYETRRQDPRPTPSRGENLAHTLISTPATAEARAEDASVLDHLPPLDLPAEVTEKTVTPPVAPAADRPPQAPPATPATAGDPLGGRPSREAAPATTLAPIVSDPTSTAGPVPGIARFVAVDLKLAGGSAPSAAGLDWLAEKGYRTLVDLRPSREVDPAFIADAARRGLRYIALPIGPGSLDREHVSRFNFELASNDARPLFFFDATGARAGALWYIRRITIDQVNSQVARREALDLGCGTGEDWLAATAYLDRLDRPRPRGVEPAASTGGRPGL